MFNALLINHPGYAPSPMEFVENITVISEEPDPFTKDEIEIPKQRGFKKLTWLNLISKPA